jgi:GNAT superfamily N-acetyltransferase
VVLEEGGRVAACLIGYPLPDEPEPIDYERMPAMFVPLQELENLAPGTWYVNVLAAYPECRGQGYGTRLLGQGKRMNACSCALADEALEVDRVPPRALPAVLERGCGLGLVQQVQGHVPDHGHVLRRMAGAQA